jgi:hypothetical protein
MIPAAVEIERPASGKIPPSMETIAPGILSSGFPVEYPYA